MGKVVGRRLPHSFVTPKGPQIKPGFASGGCQVSSNLSAAIWKKEAVSALSAAAASSSAEFNLKNRKPRMLRRIGEICLIAANPLEHLLSLLRQRSAVLGGEVRCIRRQIRELIANL